MDLGATTAIATCVIGSAGGIIVAVVASARDTRDRIDTIRLQLGEQLARMQVDVAEIRQSAVDEKDCRGRHEGLSEEIAGLRSDVRALDQRHLVIAGG